MLTAFQPTLHGLATSSALAFRQRVTQRPTLTPAADPTINFVIARQELYIREMVQAVFNMDNVNDNPTFRGLAMFTLHHENQVCGYEVEAACRVLFAAVIKRCQIGYCGSVGNNRLLNKDFALVDQDGSCLARITNVIKALREWKSVCKEIIVSDFKILHLANAPATVAEDKMTQKKNNRVKKERTDKERAAADSTAQTSVGNARVPATATQAARNDTVRSSPGQLSRRKKPKSKHGKNETSPETRQSSVPSSATVFGQGPTLSYEGITLLSDDHFPAYVNIPQGPPTYPNFNPGNLPADPPAYPSTFQRQGYPSVVQSRPMLNNFPLYNSHGPGIDGSGSQNFGGHAQGLAPISYQNYFNGPYTQYHFNDRSFPHTPSSFGGLATFNSAMQAGNVYGPPFGSIPATFSGGLDANNATDNISGGLRMSQTGGLNQTAAKHARTATADASLQPLPTRIKRDQMQDGTSKGFENVAEEDASFLG